MKKNLEKIHIPSNTAFQVLNILLGVGLCVWALVVPFLPDVRLIRLKLAGFEFGIFIAFFMVGLKGIFSSRESLIKQIKPSNKYISILDCGIGGWILINVGLWGLADEKILATPELRRVLLAGGCYFVFRFSELSENWVRKFIFSWVLAAGFLSFYGVLQKTGGIGSIDVPHVDRIFSTYGNPIFFAAYLVPSLFLSFLCHSLFTGNGTKFLIKIIIGIQFVALTLTRTRAAWIAVGICALIWIVRTFSRQKIPIWVWGGSFVGLLMFGLHPQELRAERMKSGYPRATAVPGNQPVHTLAHLRRGFVSKGNSQNIPGTNVVGNKIGNAAHNNPRFTRSRARQNKKGPVGMLNRLFLRRIKIFEM